MSKKILIGIDPGKKTGMAIKQQGCEMVLKTFSFWEAIDAIKTFSPDVIKVFIEDPSQNKPIFSRFRVPPAFYKIGDRISYIGNIAQKIGENKGQAKLLIEYMKKNNIEHYAMRPNKRSMTKVDKKTFEKLTGYTKRSSEHSRDAAFLIIGRS